MDMEFINQYLENFKKEVEKEQLKQTTEEYFGKAGEESSADKWKKITADEFEDLDTKEKELILEKGKTLIGIIGKLNKNQDYLGAREKILKVLEIMEEDKRLSSGSKKMILDEFVALLIEKEIIKLP